MWRWRWWESARLGVRIWGRLQALERENKARFRDATVNDGSDEARGWTSVIGRINLDGRQLSLICDLCPVALTGGFETM